MTYAKKMIVPVLCVLLGCAGGAAMGNVTAQTWPEPANVQRWQQECVYLPMGGPNPSRAMARVNTEMQQRGAQGWEAFSFADAVSCFKRPAP